MKEITRIHIAKVPYDIEISAKKQLESYLKTLGQYGSDPEIIADIEIRITEILADRGVKKDNVISDDDVAAFRHQLGEPSEFMGEGDIAVGPTTTAGKTTGKLFRDTDTAIMGGVLSGLAAFFNVNPVWVRLIFVIVALVSLGAALLVYVVLWVVVPPAKTAADKLQMRGKPVTISSIREYNENEITRSAKKTGVAGKRFFTALLGVGAALTALVTMLFTVGITIAAVTQGRDRLFAADDGTGLVIAAFVLTVVSGLLLTVLCIIAAYASFAQKVTRRILILMGVVVVIGLASFGTAIGLVQYSSMRHTAAVQASTRETAVGLPVNSQLMNAIDSDTKDLRVKYIVTNEPPTATLRTVDEQTYASKVAVTFEGKTLVVRSDTSFDECRSIWCHDMQPTVIIKGPALESLRSGQDSSIEYVALEQEKLAVNAGRSSKVAVESGSIGQVTLASAEDSLFYAPNATILTLSMDIASVAELNVGTIEQFTVVSKNACPQGVKSVLNIEHVTSGTMTINGNKTNAATKNIACANILVNSEENK